MNKRLTGALYLLGSSAIYGFFGILYKQISIFGPFTQGVIRFSIALSLILIVFLSGKVKWKKIEHKDIKWFLAWILPASVQPILTFIAFVHLPIGIAYFITYSTMILGGIICGKIFFSEKLNPKKAISLVLIFTGLILIYKSDISLITNGYILLALLSGMIVGFWNTLTKKVSSNYSEFQMMFMDGSSTLIVSLLGIVIFNESIPSVPNIIPWLWILLFAVAMISSSYFLIRGFKNIDAQTGSLILPMELVFASIFGYLFLGEVLAPNVYFGGLLIFLAAIFPVVTFPNTSVKKLLHKINL